MSRFAIGETDFEHARRNSSSAGTPLLWKVDGFSRTYLDFGIERIPGWEPSEKMDQAIDLYWTRSSNLMRLALKALLLIRLGGDVG